MGGSGGRGFFSRKSDPEKLSSKVRESEAKAQDQKFTSDVSQIINDLLAKYNSRDIEAIQKHLDTIKFSLEKEIDGSVELLFGGSVAKHTYIDGLSDVDVLVLLNKSELKDKSPREVMDYFLSRLKTRLPQTDITAGTLAITAKFKDSEIQLLPAVRYESGFRISSETGRKWSPIIKPEEFAKRLREVNQQQGGKLIPAIKLAKSILNESPKNYQISGYHIEALATNIFVKYAGSRTTKAMLTHFFSEAPKHLLGPIKDKTGQSIHVDDYLGAENSQQRKNLSTYVDRIGRRMKNADGGRLVQQWREILGA